MQIAIYGAKALALGMYKAIHELYPETSCIGFLVNSSKNNPWILAGLPVTELEELKKRMVWEKRKSLQILICTPEDIHGEITVYLEQNGFKNYICMDSQKEAILMERYFAKLHIFPSLHTLLEQSNFDKLQICVYQAKFYKDKKLKNSYGIPDWVVPIQVGAALTDIRVADVCDNTGTNISEKNVNYCELTALYWIWKNKLVGMKHIGGEEYYGLFHYRRILDISDDDIRRIAGNDVDVVLSFPTLHEPDISEHHTRYLSEKDWAAMLAALQELEPDYAKAFPDILAQPYLYNYNMMIAKEEVLENYCEWLFPILERTEELSSPKGWERADRYIGYLGENLMTLYFLYNQNRLKIYHTGRLMLT